MKLFLIALYVSGLCVPDSFSATHTCQLIDGMDVEGAVLEEINGQQAGSCCALCSNHWSGKCRAFAWNDHRGGTCWLKESTGLIAKDQVKAAVLQGEGCSSSMEQDVDYWGNDLWNVPNINSASECCGVCAEEVRCLVYTYSETMRTCYLKHTVGSKSECTHCVSGIKDGSQPPPSPPPPPPPSQSCSSSLEYDVDYFGNDLWHVSNINSPTECCSVCEETSQCAVFTYSETDKRCYLKHTAGSKTACAHCVSGKKNGSPGPGPGPSENWVHDIKGTMWGPQTDAGGCSMPMASYTVQEAVALGDHPNLGYLKHKNSLCGQVLNIKCGGETVQAIVASTCNIRSGTCGVDMIRKTWNTITGNKSPGIVTCSVSLSHTRSMSESSPLCFFRPDARSGASAWYTSVGVFNTAGKLVTSANLAGVQGKPNGDSGYFDFSGNGGFVAESDLVVRFDDGSSFSVMYSQCKGVPVKIWS